MKFGFRKPSIKKSFKARTTGSLKRSIKKSLNPFYGKKGIGYIKNPKKAVYNKIYNKTSFDLFKPLKKNKTASLKIRNGSKSKKRISMFFLFKRIVWLAATVSIFIGPFIWNDTISIKFLYWIICLIVSVLGYKTWKKNKYKVEESESVRLIVKDTSNHEE